MAVAWFIAPYMLDPDAGVVARYCTMRDFDAAISADGGRWSETEVLGDRAIVKVRASASTLASIGGYEIGDGSGRTIKRVPKDMLDDSLADLPTPVKNALRNEVQDAGYTLSEINSRFPGNLGDYTLRDVLSFMASRRRKPRVVGSSYAVDGIVQNCKPVQDVDAEVTG